MENLDGWALYFLETFLLVVPFVLSLMLHELAHGYTAKLLGDNTAQKAGRLTLNPLRHIDVSGLVAFLVIRIGWARPMPISERFKDDRKGLILVAVAGPAANLVAAYLSYQIYVLILSLLPYMPETLEWSLLGFLKAFVWINLLLAVFNLMPFPPLDGYKILAALLPKSMLNVLLKVEPYGILILLILFLSGVLQQFIMTVTGIGLKVLGLS